MKNTTIATIALSLTATAAMALPPKPGVTHTSVADTLPPPSSGGIGWGAGTAGTTIVTWYRYLGLPVIAQTTPNDRLYAFPGRVNLVAGITAANDEGVLSNGPGYSWSGLPGNPTVPALIEGSPIGANFLGNLTGQLAAGSTLTNPSVQRLQISSNGIVACQTFSNDTINVFREGIAANSSMLSLGAASAILPMTDRQPGVMDDDCQNIAAREQWVTAPLQRVNRFRFPGGTGLPMNPLPLSTSWFVASTLPTPLGGLWWPTQGAVARPGSPSISAAGVVAAHCIDNLTVPFQRPHIRIEDPTGAQSIVMRQGTPCGLNAIPGANFFGVVNSSLMALNNRAAAGNNKDVIAWQMTNMRSAPNSGIINLPSLWCRQTPFPPTCTYITHGGGAVPAPGIAAHFFNSFYALHVTEDPTNPSISRVIFGVNLVPASTPPRRAIYSCDISGGLAGPLTLIATNVPGVTPLQPYTGGTDELATFGTAAGTSGHLFSVSRYGEVLFKATVGANITPPGTTPGQRQVLVVAAPPTYGLEVWAQSGITSFTSIGGTTATFTNFTLTQPDQGTYSRGQGIASLPAPLGTSIIFRGHSGANHAIILAN
ncbi:MAG: hypothetical protein MUF86_08140 [Akkermansiaceae bacterium]|jgi:hypothetical protein|nr:hypothetical protein [Akkermansiaceae bacterium]